MSAWFSSDRQSGQPPTRTEPTIWREDGKAHIDLRGMEPPGPALALLELLDAQPDDGQVIAHLDRQPVFVYEELEERGWGWVIEKDEPGEVRLALRRRDHDGTESE
jgi:hypothetical protein